MGLLDRIRHPIVLAPLAAQVASYPGARGERNVIGTAPDGRVMRVVVNAKDDRTVCTVWPDSTR